MVSDWKKKLQLACSTCTNVNASTRLQAYDGCEETANNVSNCDSQCHTSMLDARRSCLACESKIPLGSQSVEAKSPRHVPRQLQVDGRYEVRSIAKKLFTIYVYFTRVASSKKLLTVSRFKQCIWRCVSLPLTVRFRQKCIFPFYCDNKLGNFNGFLSFSPLPLFFFLQTEIHVDLPEKKNMEIGS